MMAARHLKWLLTGALVAGIAGGALWPPPPVADSQDADTPWALPPVNDLQRHVPQDLATVIRDLPWNAGGATPEVDAAATRWRLAGIVSEQQQPLILVVMSDQPGQVQRIHPGEPLPDDSVLDAVEHDRALIRRGECVTTWRLFHPQPIATSDACQQAEPDPQGTSS